MDYHQPAIQAHTVGVTGAGLCSKTILECAALDQSIASASSQRSPWTTEDVRNTVERSKVVVFLKGTPDAPRCGFSERVVSVMERCGRPYEVINVYEDRSIIPALTAFAGRQCLPLVYINGKLESSSETQEQFDTGEFKAKVDAAFEQ